jgi:hypothetical protein
MTLRSSSAVLVLLLVMALPSHARAQSEHLIAAGIGVSASQDNGGSWNRSVDWFAFRLPRPEHLGISWDIGSESFDVPAAATPSGAAGSLKSRHFLFGPGYTWRAAPAELTLSGLFGPTMNTFTIDQGRSPVNSDVTSPISWTSMADVTTWIDLAPRWGLKISVDYMFERPTFVLVAGPQSTTWSARRFHSQVGVVFGIY